MNRRRGIPSERFFKTHADLFEVIDSLARVDEFRHDDDLVAFFVETFVHFAKHLVAGDVRFEIAAEAVGPDTLDELDAGIDEPLAHGGHAPVVSPAAPDFALCTVEEKPFLVFGDERALLCDAPGDDVEEHADVALMGGIDEGLGGGE